METDGDDDQTFEGEGSPENITEELEESEGSNSSDSDEDEASSTNPRIQQLELQVETNPYHYDSHVELITILRETGDLDRVRTAREGMNKIFPLSEDIWTTWLKDEMPLAMGSLPEQAERIIALFERAVKDYQSVSLWILYCQFLMDTMQDPSDIQKIRLTFEKAITATGLHVTEGPSIWEGYRKFEMDLLESLEQMVTHENEETRTEKISAQRDKVMSIFKRQLAVPLIGMQATLREFEDWLEDSVPEAVMIAYEKALAKLEECLSFEDLLATAKAPKVTEYKLYLDYELKKDDPARLQCLYERFVKDNCLLGDTWNEYTAYLDSNLKIPSVVIPVHERAVRNCPWVSLLWQNYLRALERNKQDGDKVKETFNTALGCGFSSSDDYLQLWQCYCDYMRRRVEDWSEESQQVKELRETFTRATEYLRHYFGSDGDPTNILERYWARIEALHIGNIPECQRLWDSVILSRHGREAEYWLEYSHLLRSCKNNQLCRKVLQRAVQAASDNPEMVIQALLSFEREEGTLEDWDTAFSRCRVQLLRVNERRQKAAAKEEARAKAEKETLEKRKLLNTEKKAAKKAEQKKAKIEVKKRKAPDSGPKESPKGVEDIVEPVTKKPHIVSESRSGKSDFSAEPGTHVQTSTTTTTTKHSHDSSKDPRTVFVSNLLFSIDEERIKDVFSPLGEVTQIRLVKNNMGRSKGYAYVEFKDESAVQAALSMDRTKLDGRPMFISPSIDKSKNPTQFKFPTTLDKKTLFVSNLPFEIKESDLENLFREYGKLKQVRLVSNRAGKPKGFGYIEYDEESAASAAIVALDGTHLGDRQISVALSNPPSRKPRQPGADQPQTKQQVGSRGRARTQLQLIPRSLQKHTPPAPVPKAASVTTSSSEKTEIKNGVEAKQQGLSNDYFRNLMTKKN